MWESQPRTRFVYTNCVKFTQIVSTKNDICVFLLNYLLHFKNVPSFAVDGEVNNLFNAVRSKKERLLLVIALFLDNYTDPDVQIAQSFVSWNGG